MSRDTPVGNVCRRASVDPHSVRVPQRIEILVDICENVAGRRRVGGLRGGGVGDGGRAVSAVVLDTAYVLGGEQVGVTVVNSVHPLLVVTAENTPVVKGVDVRIPKLRLKVWLA